MSALDRLPPWATTGVGSLPHADVRAAAEHAVQRYDVAFCPQLPRLEGDMLVEWLGADPRRCGWNPERDRERPRAWEALLSELDSGAESRVVKLQVTGPVTLARALSQEVGDHGDAGLRTEIATWTAANVAAQVRALAARGHHALVMVDEPALAAVAGGRELDRSWDPYRSIGAPWGLHLCCAVPWDLIDSAAPDVLSFDLVATAVDRRAVATIRSLLARGGRVAWGVTPVQQRDERVSRVGTASGRLAAAVLRCGADGSQSLLTASCGTGRQAIGREHEIAASLGLIASAARAHWPAAIRATAPFA